MKKISILLILILIFLPCTVFARDVDYHIVIGEQVANASYVIPKYDFNTYFGSVTPSEGSLEEIYQDVFMALLSPYIGKAVEDYYGQPFSVDPWANKVLYIRRPNGYRTIYFEMELRLIPYYGPHRSVGIDHITLTVTGDGNVVVHIETHDWHY